MEEAAAGLSVYVGRYTFASVLGMTGGDGGGAASSHFIPSC